MTKRSLTLVLAALISCLSLPSIGTREHAARFLEEILPLEETANGPRDRLVEGWQAHTPINATYLYFLGTEDSLDMDRVKNCSKSSIASEVLKSNPLALACALADLPRVHAMLLTLPADENLNQEQYWTQGFRQPYTLVEATLSGKFGLFSTKQDTYMVGTLEDRIQILELLRERGVPFVGSQSKWQGPGYYNNPPLSSLRADGHALFPQDEIEALYMEAARLGADVTEGGSSYHRGEHGPFRHDAVMLTKYRMWHREGKAGWLHENTKTTIHAKMLAEIAELQALAGDLDPTSQASSS